ncbi:MAG: aminoglycoside phosphotransferase family protein, partial [Planctomycetia bacterium]|nr:aminoglycoside phosphotransferase family protein [Planctomycetia bacterium]
FFEETKEAKLARIAAIGCTQFVDDLPELLVHPQFPAGVRRVLFDPHGRHGLHPGIDLLASWHAAPALFAGERQPASGKPPAETTGPAVAAVNELLSLAGLPQSISIESLSGGGNNRVYRVRTAAGPVLLKEYFRRAGDPRDRLGAEQAFSRFAWEHGVGGLPRPLACDPAAGIAIQEFVDGRKLAPGEVTAAHVDEAAAFLAAVNRHRADPAAARLPIASEACFSIAEHLACVDRRLARLAAIEPESDLHRQAAALVAARLVPRWKQVRATVVRAGLPFDAPLASAERVISPSDFGFHNSIATPEGLKFIDFEYAGWDDPAKTVCDFFCQPAVPVPREHFGRFLEAVAGAIGGSPTLRDRVALLLPVYELKWCCIMLNEFLPVGDDRRTFARGDESQAARHRTQLNKVEAALARLDA